jgi:hypothetical protein
VVVPSSVYTSGEERKKRRRTEWSGFLGRAPVRVKQVLSPSAEYEELDVFATRQLVWQLSQPNTLDFVKILVTRWVIWTVRRKAIHEGEHKNMLSTHCFDRRFLDELWFIPEVYQSPLQQITVPLFRDGSLLHVE